MGWRAFMSGSISSRQIWVTKALGEGSIRRLSHFSDWLLGQANIFTATMAGEVFLFPADIDLINCTLDIPQRQGVSSERNSKQWYNSTGHLHTHKSTSSLIVPFGQVWFSKDITLFNEGIHDYYQGSWGWVSAQSLWIKPRALHEKKVKKSRVTNARV